MLGIPEVKRVRRDELTNSDVGSRASVDPKVDEVVREKLRAKLASAFDFSFEIPTSREPPANIPHAVADAAIKNGDAQEDDEDEPKEFEFRLFATGSSQPTKIVLETDKPVKLGEGTVLMPNRPLTYFLAPRATGKLRHKFDDAAVSGDDVMAYAHQRWWGREMTWKIIARIPANGSLASTKTNIIAQQESITAIKPKRNRPCKKQRVKKHVKERAEKAKKEEEAKKLMSKEDHLREKKKRMNHLKKLRRKAKEKAEKAGKAAKASAAGLPPPPADSDVDDDGSGAE